MSIWLGFIGVLIVYLCVVVYLTIITRKWLLPNASKKQKVIYIVITNLFLNSFIIGMLVQSSVVRAIGSYGMAILYILFITVPILHIIVMLLRFSRISRKIVEQWAGRITLAFIVVIMCYGTFNAYSPVVHTYDITIKGKQGQAEPLNIVMAADMHFGVLSEKNHAKRMVEKINKLNPDLVLYPGDIVDDNKEVFVKQDMADILSEVQSTYGVYASLGNHDKGDIPDLIQELEKSGMNVLYDEMTLINDAFTLIGRKDKTESERASLQELLENVDQTKPIILLDHQPYELDIAQEAGIDLMVSGHTHHGQLAPFQFITDRIYENDWGHLQKEQFHSVVTSGFGFWGPPIRTSSRSEIIQINVTFVETE